MQKFFVVIFVLSLAVSSVIAQNKPKMVVQKFEVQKGVQFSLENLDVLMKDIVEWLKYTKKFSEVQRFSPPFTTDPNADFTPPTDYLMTGIITKQTSGSMFMKIMSYGMINETKIYLTFTVTDRRNGTVLIKKDIKGVFNDSFLGKASGATVLKISNEVKKALKKKNVQ